jgi:acylphosphatase
MAMEPAEPHRSAAVRRRRIVVRGRVQGVFFRDSCRREAQRLGVRGWARNLEDGSVEVVAEGDDMAVRELERWCATGPPRALVTAVDGRDEPPASLEGFRTR